MSEPSLLFVWLFICWKETILYRYDYCLRDKNDPMRWYRPYSPRGQPPRTNPRSCCFGSLQYCTEKNFLSFIYKYIDITFLSPPYVKMRHPHVLCLHEIYEDNNTVYIILDLVTGGELFQKVKQTKTNKTIESINQSINQWILRSSVELLNLSFI